MTDTEADSSPPPDVTWFGLPARRVLWLAVTVLIAMTVVRYYVPQWVERFDSRPKVEREYDKWIESATELVGETADTFILLNGVPARVQDREDGGRRMEYESFLLGNNDRFAPHAFTVYIGPDKRVERVESKPPITSAR